MRTHGDTAVVNDLGSRILIQVDGVPINSPVSDTTMQGIRQRVTCSASP